MKGEQAQYKTSTLDTGSMLVKSWKRRQTKTIEDKKFKSATEGMQQFCYDRRVYLWDIALGGSDKGILMDLLYPKSRFLFLLTYLEANYEMMFNV